MRWEFNAVRRAFLVDRISTVANLKCVNGRSGQANVFLFLTGVGSHKTAEVCQATLEGHKWDFIMSTGYVGALTPSRIGAILVADHVLMDTSSPLSDQPGPSLTCHPDLSREAFKVALSVTEQTRMGRIVTVPRIVSRAVEKHELAQRTGAIGLDMESAVIGKAAHDQKIPFVVVRAVSDLVDEDLPIDFNLFLQPFGWVQGLSRVIMSPSCWADLMRLNKQMGQASRQMTIFYKEFLGQLRVGNDYRTHGLAM